MNPLHDYDTQALEDQESVDKATLSILVGIALIVIAVIIYWIL